MAHVIHAVQMMGANIELWQYRRFENETMYFEEVFRRSAALAATTTPTDNQKNPIMVAAGKKAAITRAHGVYSVNGHLKDAPKDIRLIAQQLRDFILELDDSIEETPKKLYIAYKVSQNFVCMELQQRRILLYLKLNPAEFRKLPPNGRDVRKNRALWHRRLRAEHPNSCRCGRS